MQEDVWVDGDGYVRQVRAALPGLAGSAAPTSLTMDFFDFGAPVQVRVPPAADVADLAGAAVSGLRRSAP